MSKAPPFPTRRRAPSLTNSNAYQAQPLSAPGSSTVRPLQISRPPSRSATPINGSFTSAGSPVFPPNTAPIGPSRPQRSELRSGRTSEYSDRASMQSQELYRDSADSSPPTRSRPKPSRLQSVNSDDGQENTPTSLTSALSAFQSAGSRRKMTLDEEDLEYHRERENELEAEKQQQQRLRDKVPKMRTTGKSKTGDIDAVLDQVKDGWEFVIDPDFNTVDLALQLLDESSLGKDMESFRNTKNLLSKALQSSVDKHYQAFAASLPHHASLLNHLASVQSQASNARSTLFESKEALGNKRADLVQLWSRSQILDEMIKMLDQIEHLKTVPDMLETLISEKRLLQASVLLVRALKVINKPEMLEIGAVADLRSYLSTQEVALCDILVDELQSHLYLKSFWCESRWAGYMPNQHSIRKPEFEEESDQRYGPNPPPSPDSTSFHQTRLTRFLNDLALRPNDPPHDLNTPGSISTTTTHLNSSGNPEADSFAYMETLLESLAVLGKLGTALDTITQRVSGELFALVEGTLDEVEERAEFGRRKTITLNSQLGKTDGLYILSSIDSNVTEINTIRAKGQQRKASDLRLSALEPSTTRLDHEILKDLFWTLYSKLDAVAQGFRVIFEVANRIGSRRDFKDPSGTKPGVLFPLSEMWNPVETEVRTLIYDYLTDEQQGSVTGRNPISSINEILREGKFSRDKIKPVFRFADTDMKATNKALKPHEDGLTRVLKDTMPGLVPPSLGDTVHTTALTTVSTDERMLGLDQHHRLLIRPDAFHVTVLFQPTLCFLERIADVLPSGLQSVQASNAVLDDFVIKAYLPQLEEKVLELFQQAVTGIEAFRPDSFSLHFSPHPLVKASIQLLALVNSLCTMLCSSPFHRESYTRLILAVVIQFYQRCSDRFQSLTSIKSPSSGLEPKLALAGHWIQRAELNTCLSELFTSMTDNSKRIQLCRQETHIETEFLRSKNLTRDDLIPSMRNIAALANLYRSVTWFSSELMALKANSEDVTSPGNLESLSAITPYTPHLPTLPSKLSSGELQLPLSREMSLRFQALLKTYEQLSRMILDTIRIDLRCRVIYYIEAVFHEANHAPGHEVADPDESIVHLNTELTRCDEYLRASLPEMERRYIFAGLGDLMEHTIISSARLLQNPNHFGIQLILKDIQALQQSIKILVEEDSVDFERSKAYYTLFFISPQEMLDGIRQKQLFTFDEYQTMLNLQCGVNPSEGDIASSKATDRNYSMYVIDLHGLEING